MLEMKVGSIILTHNTRPVGIVTEHDLVKDICATDLLASKIPAESIMSSPFITADKKISVKIAAKEMSRRDVNHLLVEDTKMHDIIGIVASSDIMNFLRYQQDRVTFTQ
jgi:signal-transduction protein with cAMP-binding, CBS, and nucleotidyltransferase domain